MITFKSYKELEADTLSGRIVSVKQYVRFASKPIQLDVYPNGNNMLHNGQATYLNSKMGNWLASQGLSGLLFISVPGPNRSADRWVSRFVNEPIQQWLGNYHFYHLGDPNLAGDRFSAFPLTDDNINHRDTNRRYQELYDGHWDGFLIVGTTRKGELVYYRKLPSRSITGSIRAFVCDDTQRITGAIVAVKHSGCDYTIKTSSVPAWLRDASKRANEYLGKRCVINYTSFTPGDRVSNFTSPRLVLVNH